MSELRYLPFSAYLKGRFGERVHKVSVDAGFTCPNRDGVKSRGGCTYCNNEGFSYNSRLELRPVREQIETGMAFASKRFNARKYMAYFQASTNTYAPLPILKSLYDEILPYREIVALAVGTRPDSVSPDILDLLASYQPKREVWVEFGLQTSHNVTLRSVNRRDSYERFLWAVDEADRRGLKICVHVILGLPGETREMMMQTADRLAPLPYHSVKIHLLHVVKDTIMAKQYERGEIQILGFEEYVSLCCDFIERIAPCVSIQRLTADAPPGILIAPQWCLQRRAVIDAMQAEFERRETRQGIRWDEKAPEDDSWKALARVGGMESCVSPVDFDIKQRQAAS